jgi:hypothetical protein
MATDMSASIIHLHQPQKAPERSAPKTPAERARAYRPRKRQKAAQGETPAIVPTIDRAPVETIEAAAPVSRSRLRSGLSGPGYTD